MEPLSVAPMMDVTDRHFRWIMRRIAPRTRLYSEMVTTGALLHGERERFLTFDPSESPVALQLGGDDPVALAACARMAEDQGYDEVNLNVGCPSPRVQRGSFGVCLMARPEHVAEAVAAMQAAVRIPVTVKHRIGFDDLDRYEDMLRFVDVVSATGCRWFMVHARKAWLSGLSPKDNRTVPPLRHEEVHRLKAERPGLWVATNGGIRAAAEVTAHLARVDSVMVGRLAWDEPMAMRGLEAAAFGEAAGIADPVEVALATLPYLAAQQAAGVPPWPIVRHLMPLLHGQPGARGWRNLLATRKDEGEAAVRAAVALALQARQGRQEVAV